jgi:RNA polymerase sigma factor (sigma-70 family)
LAWLFEIQNNVLFDKYEQHFAQCRDAKREVAIPQLQQALVESTIDFLAAERSDVLGPADEAALREEQEILRRLLGELSDEHRQVLELRREGRTMAEIAEMLGVTLGVAAGRITQATKRLAELGRELRDDEQAGS